jgi:hypothetical protein
MQRDTTPIFKGVNIFVESSIDSVSMKDSLRYYCFNIMNYGSINYIPTTQTHLNLIVDIAINNTIYRSDTTLIDTILCGSSRSYVLKYPIKWFMSGNVKNWNYSALDLPYNYRVKITDRNWNVVDAYFSKPLNEKPPIKKYDEITKDTIIYWVHPYVIDTTITLKKIGYTYKDTLIFIDNIIGCDVYSHIFFGNKYYNFTVDTCLKTICSKEIVNNNTPTISALILNAYSTIDTAKLKTYINNSLIDISGNRSDSTFINLITKPFKDILTVEFKSNNDWVINKATLNGMNLLNSPTISVIGLTKVNGVYKVLASIKK